MDRHNTREKCEGDWWMCPLTGFVWVRFVARWPLPSPNGQQDEVSIAKSQTCPPEPEFVCEPSLLSGLEDIKHLSSSLCSQSYFMSLLHLVNSQSLGNSQNYNFSRNHVWMWELVHEEGWVPKNWWTVVLEKTLESPLDCKEVKPVNLWLPLPEYSLEGLILKVKLQYLGHLMRRADSLDKTVMPGKTEGRRRRGRQRMRRLDGITDSVDMSLSKL